jgi:hypothetical protein
MAHEEADPAGGLSDRPQHGPDERAITDADLKERSALEDVHRKTPSVREAGWRFTTSRVRTRGSLTRKLSRSWDPREPGNTDFGLSEPTNIDGYHWTFAKGRARYFSP